MFIDARTVPEGKVIETDVCIIGAGAAGITLAREFMGQPFRVCLLESGGLAFDAATQSLAEGASVGRSYPELSHTRLRYFGGTTNVWSGWCRPLDEIDFESREGIAYSGWPFNRTHLEPYYTRAQTVLQLGPNSYDGDAWQEKERPRLGFAGNGVATKFFQISAPTRFGKVYRTTIEQADNVTTYLYANTAEIETTPSAGTVTRVRIACLSGSRFWVSGRVFILAAGGIENARLLLVSNKVQRGGVGNQHDLVGRFFMERPHVESALMVLADRNLDVDLYEAHKVNGTTVRGVLGLSAETLRREKLLNSTDVLYRFPREAKGLKSLRTLVKAMRGREMPPDFSFLTHIGNVIADLDDVMVGVYRKLAGQRKGGPVEAMVIETRAEQVPNPDSRVTLGPDRDRLGLPRVRLDWRLSGMDKWSIRRTHEILAQEVGRAGLGRLRLLLNGDDTTWPESMPLYHHHTGTTRMHVDPKRGVVNEHCRVHGVSNLFVAGSSVFPTAGGANPTLTIVALAVRLADHVKRLMK